MQYARLGANINFSGRLEVKSPNRAYRANHLNVELSGDTLDLLALRIYSIDVLCEQNLEFLQKEINFSSNYLQKQWKSELKQLVVKLVLDCSTKW